MANKENVLRQINNGIILNRMNIVCIMQVLLGKGIVSREEMAQIRMSIMEQPRYKDMMKDVQGLEEAFQKESKAMNALAAVVMGEATDEERKILKEYIG